MFRYLALAWNDDAPSQVDAMRRCSGLLLRSREWREVVNEIGLRVFCAGMLADAALQPHLLANGSGVVLGTLFHRLDDPEDDAPSPTMTLEPLHARAIVHSRGRWLIERCWGNYVAIIRDAASGQVWVVKDPTGPLPCFRTTLDGMALLFSCIADCVACGLQHFSINGDYLRSHLVSGGLPEEQSLNEVMTIHRGECMQIDTHSASLGSPVRQFYWRPMSFPDAEDLITDPDTAARVMRNAVRSSTRSWASRHDSLLLRLSGGLDSSIVAGCLRDADGPRVTAYTYYHPGGRSDERPWARLAAHDAGCEHVEYPITPAGMPLPAVLLMQPAVEPAAAMGYLQRSVVEQRLAIPRRATAVFNGEGGDSGFCSDSVRYAATDYLRHRGLGPDLFRLTSQIALLTERSSWSVLIGAIRDRWADSAPPRPREWLSGACRLVSDEIVAASACEQNLAHPWFSSVRHVPWDTITRMGTLVSGYDFYNVSADMPGVVPEVVSPLCSQPVIELLLRIPLYVHFEGGRDRGLARRAFVREVPEPILQRLWKDRAPNFFEELLARHRTFLQEVFLDGVLVREGLLKRRAVEQALSGVPDKSQVLPAEIFRHLDTEIWARSWGSSAHAALRSSSRG